MVSLPWSKFWVRNWKASTVTDLDISARGLLHELAIIAHEVGHGGLLLRPDGTPMTLSEIATRTKVEARRVGRLMGQLEVAGFVGTDEAGAYTVRHPAMMAAKTAAKMESDPEQDQELSDLKRIEKIERIRDIPNQSPSRPPARARSKPHASAPALPRTPEPAASSRATRTGKVRQAMFPAPPAPLPDVVRDLDLATGLKECAAILGVDDVEQRWPGFSRMIVELLEPRAYSYFERVVKHALKGLAWRAKDIEGCAYFRVVITRVGERVGYDTLSDETKLRLAWCDETWQNLLRSNPEPKRA